MRRSYRGNAVATTLSGAVSAGAGSFVVATNGGTSYPDGTGGPFVVVLDYGTANEEKVLCSSRSADTFTVQTRGYDGTAATSHASAAGVRHTISAVDLDEANAHVNATAGVHGLSGTVVGTTDTQTLTNKSLTNPTINGIALTGTIAPDPSTAYQATSGKGVAGGYAALDGTGKVPAAQLPSSSTKTVRVPHTFTITGGVAVPVGDTSYIPPFFISLPTGQTAVIAAVRHRIHGGTSATWTISHGTPDAGTSVTGLTGIASTTTVTTTAASGANTLANGDAIQLVVTAVSGAPVNMTVTVFVDYTV